MTDEFTTEEAYRLSWKVLHSEKIPRNDKVRMISRYLAEAGFSHLGAAIIADSLTERRHREVASEPFPCLLELEGD